MAIWKTDSLPIFDGRYLVCDKKGNVSIAYLENESFSKTGANGSYEVLVLGWMYLPEPLTE